MKKKNIRNSNRIISMTRAKSYSELDGSDWRHILYNIYATDSNVSGPISHKAIQNIDGTDLEKTIVSNEVDLLFDEKIGFNTANNFEELGAGTEDILSNSKRRMDNLLNRLSPKAKLISMAISKAGGVITDIADAGIGLYDIANDLKAASTDSTGMSFAPWQENLRGWSGSSAILKFSYTFNFAMGQYGLWNAKEEVYKPILNLAATALPRYMSKGGISGPFPTVGTLLAKFTSSEFSSLTSGAGTGESATTADLIPGYAAAGQDPKILAEKSASKDSTIPFIAAAGQGGDLLQSELDQFTYLLDNTVGPYIFNMKFGNFFDLRYVMVTDATVKFSPELDQNGIPINGSVTLDFETELPMSLASSGQGAFAVRFGGF